MEQDVALINTELDPTIVEKLESVEIVTLSQLQNYEGDLTDIDGIGNKTLKKINDFLEKIEDAEQSVKNSSEEANYVEINEKAGFGTKHKVVSVNEAEDALKEVTSKEYKSFYTREERASILTKLNK